ncbi:MAG: hypothetical protein AAGF45_01200 [Pseudomonadota bacterium]
MVKMVAVLATAVVPAGAQSGWQPFETPEFLAGTQTCAGGGAEGIRTCFALVCRANGAPEFLLLEERDPPRTVDVAVVVDGQKVSRLPLVPRGTASGLAYVPARHAAVVQRLREGERVDLLVGTQRLAFPNAGSAAALGNVLRFCRGEAPVETSVAPADRPAAPAPPASDADAAGRDAFARLINEVRQELQEYCAPGETVRLAPGTIAGRAGDVEVVVELGLAECGWEFENHPFCGTRSCTVRTYSLGPDGYTLAREALR